MPEEGHFVGGDPGAALWSAHAPHQKARTLRAPGYPERFWVPDDKVAWRERFEGYQPVVYEAKVLEEEDRTRIPKGWADPPSPAEAVRGELPSYEGRVRTAPALSLPGHPVVPLNPRGRTGIEGRGLLGKWGANFAADPLVTRTNPQTGELELLAIRRKDSGKWAIPGGMVDEGEAVSQTLAREFLEETGVRLNLDDATLIYQGYVDDPRNTDNAWMETTVKHLHLSPELAARMEPHAGDDAAAVRWMPITDANLEAMYASHGEFVREAAARFEREGLSTSDSAAR